MAELPLHHNGTQGNVSIYRKVIKTLKSRIALFAICATCVCVLFLFVSPYVLQSGRARVTLTLKTETEESGSLEAATQAGLQPLRDSEANEIQFTTKELSEAPPSHAAHSSGEVGSASLDPVKPSIEEQKLKVKMMMQHAWDGYKRYAWGGNELDSVHNGRRGGIFGIHEMGATIVDSLDTLFLMDMKEELREATSWVTEHLSFDKDMSVSVFETNIRFVGGLLSAYALTKEEIFKTKAVDIGDRLLAAFDTSTGIPVGHINLNKPQENHQIGSTAVLAEVGTLYLEYLYLSHITGDYKYYEKVKRILTFMKAIHRPNGLCYNHVSTKSATWMSNEASLGALGDSFYEYLIKGYVMSSQQETDALELYRDTMKAMEKYALKKTSDGLIYFSNLRDTFPINTMDHLACFAGGMFALTSMNTEGEESEHYLELGKELTRTCHESYDRTATHIGPEAMAFDPKNSKISSQIASYILRPEVVESYFYLWRTTHDQKYRNWGWAFVLALEKHCRTSSGYSGIFDVNNPSSSKDGDQQTFFLAETLKYLYLLFEEDTVFPLNQWVFNTEAHLLPILDTLPTKPSDV